MPTVIAVVVVGAVVGGIAFFGGDDDPDELVTQSTVATAQAGSTQTTTATSQTPSTNAAGGGVPASFTLAGVTPTAVANRYPSEASARGLGAECSDLGGLETSSVRTDRLEAGESFVSGRYLRSGCDIEVWGITTSSGELRELTLQVPDPNRQQADQLINASIALLSTVGAPDPATATGYLDQFGWLSSPDPTNHVGTATIGDLRIGTFLDQGQLVFYVVPAG